MAYTKTNWVNGESPAINATNLNNIENGIYNADVRLNNNDKAIAEILMQMEIDSKVFSPNLGKFYADGTHTFSYSLGQIDATKAYCTTASGSTVTISAMIVGSITDFKQYQEVTIQDGTNKEVKIIQSVNSGESQITFTEALTNIYSGGCNVYRSNINTDTDNIKMGGYTISTTYDRSTSPVTVGYGKTNYGKGRMLVVLYNGWIIAMLYNSNVLYLYKSTNNGASWSNLCNIGTVAANSGTLTSYGNNIYVLYNINSTTNIAVVKIDASTVTNTDQSGNKTIIDTALNAVAEYPSIEVNYDGSIYASWIGTTSSYTRNNLRYSKSTNGTSWDTPSQITTFTGSNNSAISSNSIVFNKGDNTVRFIVTGRDTSDYYFVRCYKTDQSNVVIYNPNSTVYDQGYGTSVVDSNGYIHVAWAGKDYINTTTNNIMYSKSTDGGVTWSTVIKLTEGNDYNQVTPTINYDDKNNIYILWANVSSGNVYQLMKKVYSGGSWGSAEQLTSFTNGGFNVSPSVCKNYKKFTDPLVIYQADDGNSVKFRGVFIVGENTNLTDIDIRMNIVPFQNINSISAFIYSNDKFSSVDGKVSIVADSTNESYTDLTGTTITVGSNKETQMYGTVTTAQDNVVLKLTLTRVITTDDATIYKILGGVA